MPREIEPQADQYAQSPHAPRQHQLGDEYGPDDEYRPGHFTEPPSRELMEQYLKEQGSSQAPHLEDLPDSAYEQPTHLEPEHGDYNERTRRYDVDPQEHNTPDEESGYNWGPPPGIPESHVDTADRYPPFV